MSDATARVPYRRRKIMVQPAYQLRVAAVILLAILFYSGLLGVLLFYPLMVAFDAAGSSQQQLWIANQVLDLHTRFWPSVLVIAILVAIQSLFVTHRVVGPAYHLCRVMQGLGEGRFDVRAHLRRFDRLKDLEAALNALGESLQRREQAVAEREVRLRAEVAVLTSELSGAEASPAARQAARVLERLTAGADSSA